MVVVKLPRAVTLWRVSASAVADGHPTPFWRQMAWPDTVAVANEAMLANRLVEEAVTAVEVVTVRRSPVALTKVRFVTVPEVARRFVVVTEMAVREVMVPFVETKVSIVPLVAVRSDTNKDEPVALVKVVFWRLVLPRTVRTPETVAEVLNVKSAVEVPPANWIAFVVVLPAFVTVWRFGVVPEGQLVPLAKHTAIPFTNIAVEVTVVAESVLAYKEEPVAFSKLNVAIVPEVEVRVVIEPFTDVSVLMEAMLEISESPVALVKPKLEANRLVLVVFVPVAFTQVMLVRSSGPESTRFSMVAVVAAKIVAVALVKRAAGAKRLLIVEEFEVRFVMSPVEALKFVTNKLTPVPETNVRLEMVPEVETRFVKVPVVAEIVVALKVVTPRVSMKAFVA